MKKIFKNVVLLLQCALLIGFTACSDDNSNSEDDNKKIGVAFYGDEGGGASATGGRGGVVYMVTSLIDETEHTQGTLRWALNQPGERIILFKVSGIIGLKSPLTIKKGNVSIMGHSAPGDGICIKNYPLVIDADNVVVKFLRFRLGDEDTGNSSDAITCTGRRNIMIDHCSMSWSVDECASCYDNENFTMQYCIISESLKASTHPKGNHGYGGIWGGTNATFHHNLLAHHDSRNPRFNGDRFTGIIDNEKVDFRNNVIYNWGGRAGYAGEGGYYNMVNNYYKQGPSSTSPYFYRPDSNPSNGNELSPLSNTLQAIGKKGLWGKYYIAGNTMDLKNGTVTPNNDWDGVYPDISPSRDDLDDTAANREDIKKQIKLSSEVSLPTIFTQSASEAYNAVLEYAGASLKRDAVDKRVVNDVKNRTGSLIDTQAEVGGWPVYNSEKNPLDVDNDGIPDSWEDANGLDKNKSSDGKERSLDPNGVYSNLEVYLNSLVSHLYPN